MEWPIVVSLDSCYETVAKGVMAKRHGREETGLQKYYNLLCTYCYQDDSAMETADRGGIVYVSAFP